jgi:signal transduction histidine kinase
MKDVLSSLVSLSDFLVMSVSQIPGENIHDAARMIETSVQHAIKLLGNLSYWANIQNGSVEFQPEIVDLHEIVLENIVQLRSQARTKHINLTYSVNAETLVYTDYDSMCTVLHNLMVNALWFTKYGGRVNVSARVVEPFVQVTVSDTGIGIQPEDMQKLFLIDKKFRRAGTAGEHGTGLGLILCKDLIEIGGGEIWVDSTVGQGSQFTFTIPHQQTDS